MENWYGFGSSCVSVLEQGPSRSHEPGLIFLHGRFGHREIWAPVLDAFANRFRCVSPDFPGFGKSFCVRENGLSVFDQARLVLALTRRLPGASILIGHDTGGAIAQFCALERRDAVRGLVLINSCSLAHGLDARTRMSRRAIRALEGSWPGPSERRVFKTGLQELRIPVLLLWEGKEPLDRQANGLEMANLFPAAEFHQELSGGLDWIISRIGSFLDSSDFNFDVSSARRSLSR